ncbi:MAG TPA: methyltransferase domain-containing protein [Chloroflexota bacterium]|nr:methyltransferase domain-containing protein [Chloroflexota bacterium]
MAIRYERDDEHQWNSKEYVDQWITEAKPRDERRVLLLQRLAGFIPHPQDAAIRVLDLGGGYGLVSQQVLERFPKATIVLHDYSEPMFEHARRNLAWAGDRMSYVKADLFDPKWNKVFGEQFDAVVSAIAIHNVRQPARIRGIYHEIFPLVKPGGCFLNYDRMPMSTPALAAQTAGEEPAILENQLRWLREGGFDASDCLWKDMQVAIFGGFRA